MSAPFRIVAFGSSSTEGSGATTPARSYPAQLDAILQSCRPAAPMEVLNRGVGGDDVHNMVARVERDVVAAQPALVIWQVGSNDPLRGVGVTAFRTALGEGLDILRSCGAEVILMEPQWSPALDAADPAHAFVAAVREVALVRHLYVIRRFDLIRAWIASGRASPADVIGSDGLHMTDLGYRLLAEAAFEAVTQHSTSYAAYAHS